MLSWLYWLMEIEKLDAKIGQALEMFDELSLDEQIMFIEAGIQLNGASPCAEAVLFELKSKKAKMKCCH